MIPYTRVGMKVSLRMFPSSFFKPKTAIGSAAKKEIHGNFAPRRRDDICRLETFRPWT
jgi:hypothetical protein